MKLPPEAIIEYQQAHVAAFGKAISEKEAEEQANRVMNLLIHIFNRPSNENENPPEPPR